MFTTIQCMFSNHGHRRFQRRSLSVPENRELRAEIPASSQKAFHSRPLNIGSYSNSFTFVRVSIDPRYPQDIAGNADSRVGLSGRTLVHGSGEQDLKGSRKQTGCRVNRKLQHFFFFPSCCPGSSSFFSRLSAIMLAQGYTLYAHVIKQRGRSGTMRRDKEKRERCRELRWADFGIVMQMCLIGRASRPYVRLRATSASVTLQRDDHAKPNH